MRYAVRVELAALKALVKMGYIDASLEDVEEMSRRLEKLRYSDVQKYEKVFKHETYALVWAIYDVIGSDLGRYLHLGLTSNDVLDNVTMMQVRDGLLVLMRRVQRILEMLKNFVDSYRDQPILGRTHGKAATPTTIGFRFYTYLAELKRVKEAMDDSIKYIVGKVGGAVGTGVELYPHSLEFERLVLEELGLKRADGYLQVLPRDYIAIIMSRLILLSTVLEHIANEIRIMSRSGIEEVEEFFGGEQVGSSVMPHKRNPILSEKVCGISRYLRSILPSIYENVVFEDERDLRNSSFERIIIPEVFILIDEQLLSIEKILAGIRVNAKRCMDNIREAGLNVYSNIILHEAVKNGGDRQVIHSRLNKIFNKEYHDIEELANAIEEDDTLSEYLDRRVLESSISLGRCVEAANKKLDSFMSS